MESPSGFRDRRSAGILQRTRSATEDNTDAGFEELPTLEPGPGIRAVSEQGVRSGRFHFLPSGAVRTEGAAPSLEARAGFGKQRDGHGSRPHLREGILSGADEETLFRSRRIDSHFLRRAYRPSRLDE